MNNYTVVRNFVCLMAAALLVVGCANQSATQGPKNPNQGRYKVTKDYGPDALVDVSHITNAIPVEEPLSRGGNRPEYEVLGKNYKVMTSSIGYKEKGGASWYGKKFHGYKTANGEKYDMYGMTAAHKSLPIPTYVKVTNLANDKQVIVRVNDRGPFHKGRIIDLSYAAASKLSMLDNGTSQVLVEAIDPKTWQGQQKNQKLATDKPVAAQSKTKQPFLLGSVVKPNVVDNLKSAVKLKGINSQSATVVMTEAAGEKDLINLQAASSVVQAVSKKNLPRDDRFKKVHYIQVGVYSTEEAAHSVTLKVKQFDLPVLISELTKDGGYLFKVIMGPMKSRKNTETVKYELNALGFPGAHLMNL